MYCRKRLQPGRAQRLIRCAIPAFHLSLKQISAVVPHETTAPHPPDDTSCRRAKSKEFSICDLLGVLGVSGGSFVVVVFL
jgi:hypothetical protein